MEKDILSKVLKVEEDIQEKLEAEKKRASEMVEEAREEAAKRVFAEEVGLIDSFNVALKDSRILAEKKALEILQNAGLDADKINNLKFEKVEQLEKKNATLTEAVTDLLEIVEQFAATPSKEPSKKVNNPFKDKHKKEFDFSKIGQALRNNKK